MLILFFLLCRHAYPLYKTAHKKRLNLLLITIDTLRADWLSCYNSKHLKTPNIDRIAERGVLFTRAFAHTSTTLPSHTNILLGMTPPYHGVHENSNFVVRKEFLTLAEHLKSYGYSTGAFVGAFPLEERFGLNQGFDTYDDEFEGERLSKFSSAERKAEVVVARAMDWLKKQVAPWFLWIHCWDPHDPYEPPEPFKTQYKEHPYTGEVAYVDFTLGRLFSYLKENNEFDKTIIIFTGDHGESLGQHGEKTHGFFAYNTSIWIPLIILFPGLENKEVEHYVSHIDIFPTVCDIMNISKPSSLQGASLIPALQGKSMPKRYIYFESLHPYYSKGWAPQRGYIFDKEKYIHSPLPELYDLDEDFDELKNLAENKRMDMYEKQLDKVISDLKSPESKRAEKKLDRESIEKLKSLGYLSSSLGTKEESFTEDDDIKIVLPYYYRAKEAIDRYEEGDEKEGFSILKSIITERKDVGLAYINLARLYRREGRMKDGVKVLKFGHENIPSNYLLFFTYMKFLLDTERYDEAIKNFKGKSYREMEYDPEILNYLGIAYSKTRKLEHAIEIYKKALTLDSKSPTIFTNIGEAQFHLSLKEKDKSLFKNSLQSFRRAIELDPEYSFAYVGIGKARIIEDNLDAAITAFKKALELNDKHDEALYLLGRTYLEMGKKSEALRKFTLYKQKYYDSLHDDKKKKLDDLIEKCKQDKNRN